jgi:hypothetical protein
MKRFLIISTLLSTALLAGCGTTTAVQPEAKPTQPQATACTMDAKACPDGSYVGRIAPNCEFAACPAASTGEAVSCGITPSASCATGK